MFILHLPLPLAITVVLAVNDWSSLLIAEHTNQFAADNISHRVVS
jgi:hypothetical protein